MKARTMKWMALVLLASTLFTACKKDHEGEHNHEEVITTVTLKITPHTGVGPTLVYSYDDLDRPGGNNPTIQNIVLAPNMQYHFEIELMDKTKNPAANITQEINNEKESHRFYYLPSAGSNITISGLNNDANGVPVGTTGMLATGAAASGNLRVVLRHYGGNPPNKAATDAVDSPKSSTDVDVTFTTNLQ